MRAAHKQDWAKVARLIEGFRSRRSCDPIEIGYLGAAYLQLGRYERIVEEFERVQRLANPALEGALRPYFATALLWLERNQEALEQFERMPAMDATPAHRALRYWNHAIALYRLGRTHEARDLLMLGIDPAWPRPEYEQARQLLRSMGIEAH